MYEKVFEISMTAQFAEVLSGAYASFTSAGSSGTMDTTVKSASNAFTLVRYRSKGLDYMVSMEVRTFSPLTETQVLYVNNVTRIVYVPPVGTANGSFTVTANGFTFSIPVTSEVE